MFGPLLSAIPLAAFLLSTSVSAHGDFLFVSGSGSKVQGQGLGTEGTSTSGHSTFYHAPRFLNSRPQDAICGANRRNGGTTFYGIDWKTSLSGQIAKGLPVVGTDGMVTAQFFQVNKDGAGPFRCEVSADAQGKSWTPMQVTQNIAGSSRGLSYDFQKFHTLKAKLPSGTKCVGTGGACLIRCKNPNTNPFGGCMAVKQSTAAKRAVAKKRASKHGKRSALADASDDDDSPDLEARSDGAFDLQADAGDELL